MPYKLLGGGSDLGTIVNDMNTNILELKGQEVTKVYKDDQGTRVAIIDKDGLRTTAPGSGIDVFTAKDGQMTFNSARNTLKVVRSDSITLNMPSTGSRSTTVEHNLGYPPIVVASVETPFLANNYEMVPFSSFTSATNYRFIVASISATQVLFTVQLGTDAGAAHLGNYIFRYRLLQETAN